MPDYEIEMSRRAYEMHNAAVMFVYRFACATPVGADFNAPFWDLHATLARAPVSRVWGYLCNTLRP